MSKVDEARQILTALGLPKAQCNERSALTLLALANIGPRDSWRKVKRPMLRIWDIMGFMREKYKKDYAANSRETIRRQTVHQFEQARIVDRNPDDPSRPTNSGNNVYRLTAEAAAVVTAFGTKGFDTALKDFLKRFGALQEAYQRARGGSGVPLRLPDGSTAHLSPGEHNVLQVAIIEQLGPRFAPGATILYLGDTARKHAILNAAELARLSVPTTKHDKLPDIILYWEAKNWLFLIEAVTSHGPVSPKRHREIEALLKSCTAERVYITAFLDIATFRRYAADIAWETEVWVADNPDHMIHFNGPKFLGPYVSW
jgi:adenine-specific DNA-methyltransferase